MILFLRRKIKQNIWTRSAQVGCEYDFMEGVTEGLSDVERVEQGPFRGGTLGMFKEQKESQRVQGRVRRENGKM